MKGLLKTKSAGNQFLLLVSISLVSFFLVGLIGTVILSALTGMDIKEMSDMTKWDYSKPATINFIRGMQLIQLISLLLIPTFIFSSIHMKMLHIALHIGAVLINFVLMNNLLLNSNLHHSRSNLLIELMLPTI